MFIHTRTRARSAKRRDVEGGGGEEGWRLCILKIVNNAERGVASARSPPALLSPAGLYDYDKF